MPETAAAGSIASSRRPDHWPLAISRNRPAKSPGNTALPGEGRAGQTAGQGRQAGQARQSGGSPRPDRAVVEPPRSEDEVAPHAFGHDLAGIKIDLEPGKEQIFASPRQPASRIGPIVDLEPLDDENRNQRGFLACRLPQTGRDQHLCLVSLVRAYQNQCGAGVVEDRRQGLQIAKSQSLVHRACRVFPERVQNLALQPVELIAAGRDRRESQCDRDSKQGPAISHCMLQPRYQGTWKM